MSVGLFASEGGDRGPVWVEVLGCRSPNGCERDGALVSQRAVVSFSSEQVLELRMLLASACVGATCTTAQRCVPTTGECRAASEAQSTLQPYDASVSAPVDATSADAGGLDGAARDASADVIADDRRDGATDAGMDANTIDAPALDAGPDAMDAAGDTGADDAPDVIADASVEGDVHDATDVIDASSDLPDASDGSCPAAPPPRPSRFALGNTSACWLDESDHAFCWGANTYGMTTYSSSAGSNRAVRAPELDGVALAAGEFITCSLHADGTVWCAGLNTEGQLGDGSTTNRPRVVQVSGVTGATAIAAGFKHACAVVAGGAVRCWGMNSRRQLGAPTTETCGSFPCSRTAVTVAKVSGATQLALGNVHSCALRGDGAVWCWGDNAYGQMGRGGIDGVAATPAASPGLTGVRALAAGYHHTCALMGDGAVRCWGQNDQGQLGDGTTFTRAAAVPVVGLRCVEALAVGHFHGCGVVAGALSCWGINSRGQLGNGGTTDAPSPSPVTLSGITDVGAGQWHTCARSEGSTLWCWGWNLSGMLGIGSSTPSQSATPLRVAF